MPDPDNISVAVCDEPIESVKPSDEESPKEHLKLSLSNLSTLLRPQRASNCKLTTIEDVDYITVDDSINVENSVIASDDSPKVAGTAGDSHDLGN